MLDSSQSTQSKWWDKTGHDAATSITDVLRNLRRGMIDRMNAYEVFVRLYGSRNLLGPRSARGGVAFAGLASDRVRLNVTQSITDTVTSKIAKNRPRAEFLSNGGNWKQQRNAKKLSLVCDGIFSENDAYDLGPIVFRDGCIFGDGVVYVFERENRVRYERVLPYELYVDDVEALYGKPRQLHRVKYVDRQQLVEMFPEKEALIRAAQSEITTMTQLWQGISDLVEVRESWHLPSVKDAKDGKHCISVDGALLDDMDEWPHDFFPFARFQWSPPVTGWWGQGLAEQLQSIQLEINKLSFLIQRSFHLGGSFKILIENSSKIVTEHLTNDLGAVVRYSGQKPEYVVPPLVSPEIYGHLSTLYARAYEIGGVSQLSAGSQKPAGLNSGVALREYSDIETDRFRTVGQSYEAFFMELAELSLAVARQIADREGKYPVRAPGYNALMLLDLKDVDIGRENYVIQRYVASSLPNDPAGRMETVLEWLANGFIQMPEARKLLDFPDLEHADSLMNASEHYTQMVFDKMLDDGEYTQPEAFDNLQMMRDYALRYYSKGRTQGMPEKTLQLLRNFIAEVDKKLKEALPPAPPPGAAMPPGAPPMPPPMPSDAMMPTLQ